MKHVFLFPGQGAQSVGMLQALFAQSEQAAQTLAEADEALGFNLSTTILEGPEETLNLTEFTQPALVTASIAAWRAYLLAGGRLPVAAAGHSLGEYSALVAANALDFGVAVRLVHRRGQLMSSAAPEGAGGMAAIIGLDAEGVRAICAQASDLGQGQVQPANINAPGQIVISGARMAVEAACTAAKAAGAKRALPLKVSVAAHSQMMQPAVAELTAALAEVEVRAPEFPVVQNATLAVHNDPDAVRRALAAQLVAPVDWIGTIDALTRCFEPCRVIECGPGGVLAGLVKRINKDLPLHSLATPEDIAELTATD